MNHRKAKLNLCHLSDAQDGQSEISLRKRTSYCKTQASEVTRLAASIDINKRRDIKKMGGAAAPSKKTNKQKKHTTSMQNGRKTLSFHYVVSEVHLSDLSNKHHY